MAGSQDFTGQNIQDTYQRVLQISSSGQLADGTGSLVSTLNITASFAVSASHEITFEISSSHAQRADQADSADTATKIGTLTATNIGQCYDTVANVVQGTIRFTELDNTNDDLALTNLGSGGSPTFLSVRTSQARAGFAGLILPDLTGVDGAYHLKVAATEDGAQTPAVRLGSTDENIIEFYKQDGTLVSRIDPSGTIIAQALTGNLTGQASTFNPAQDQTLNNDKDLLGKETGGTARHMISMSPQNIVRVGATAQPLSIRSNGTIYVTGSFTEIIASGNISSSGYVYANRLYAGNNIAAASPSSDKIRFAYDSTVDFVEYGKGLDTSHFFYGSAITASGNISASGTSHTFGGNIAIDTELRHIGDADTKIGFSDDVVSIKAGNNESNFRSTGLQQEGHITASGNISASGDIDANVFRADGHRAIIHGSDTGITLGTGGNAARPITIFGTAITASGNISASGNVITSKTGLPYQSAIVYHADGININVDDGESPAVKIDANSGAVVIGPDIAFPSNQMFTVAGTISASNHIQTQANVYGSNMEASGHITASGNVQANHYYGYQLSVHPSNFTVALNGSYYYVPLTGQSTAEHATSNTNERIPLTNNFNGHAIKTTIRSTNNNALKNAKVTCSIYYSPPNVAPGSVQPGSSSAGHRLWGEIHRTGENNTHNVIHMDWRDPYSGSFVADGLDIPSGSRIYLAMKSDHASSVAYVVSTTFAWDYSSL